MQIIINTNDIQNTTINIVADMHTVWKNAQNSVTRRTFAMKCFSKIFHHMSHSEQTSAFHMPYVNMKDSEQAVHQHKLIKNIYVSVFTFSFHFIELQTLFCLYGCGCLRWSEFLGPAHTIHHYFSWSGSCTQVFCSICNMKVFCQTRPCPHPLTPTSHLQIRNI